MFKKSILWTLLICGALATPFYVSLCERIITAKSDLWFVGVVMLVAPVVTLVFYLINKFTGVKK